MDNAPSVPKTEPRLTARDNRYASSVTENSQSLFLLLCASLVSTLVGTVVAFVAVPPLQWLNSRALGHHLVPEPDPEASVRRVCDAMEVTAARLEAFSTLLDSAERLGGQVASLEATFDELKEQIKSMTTRFSTSAERLEHTADGMAKISIHLEQASQRLDANSQQLAQLPRAVEEPIQRLETAATAATEKMDHLLHSSESKLATWIASARRPMDIVRQIVDRQLLLVDRLGAALRQWESDRTRHERSQHNLSSAFKKLEAAFSSLLSNVGQTTRKLQSQESQNVRMTETVSDVHATLLTVDQRVKAFDRALQATRSQTERQAEKVEELCSQLVALRKAVATQSQKWSRSPRPSPLFSWLWRGGDGRPRDERGTQEETRR